MTVPNVTSRVGGQRALDRSALPRAIPGLSFAGWRGSDEDRYIFTLPSLDLEDGKYYDLVIKG